MDRLYMKIKRRQKDWLPYLESTDRFLSRNSATVSYLRSCVRQKDLTLDVLTLLASQFQSLETLLIIPGRKVAIDTYRAPSDNDIWALLKSNGELISVVIEAKIDDQHWQSVKSWIGKTKKSKTRDIRFSILCGKLGLINEEELMKDNVLPYQLLHRTYSALEEAERFGAGHAIVIVYSMNQGEDERKALRKGFERFISLFHSNPVKEEALIPASFAGASFSHPIKLYFAMVEA